MSKKVIPTWVKFLPPLFQNLKIYDTRFIGCATCGTKIV
jgi:hypothetical protein